MASRITKREVTSLLSQLEEIEEGNGDGTLQFADGRELPVSSLGKTYFPKERYTKGDLLRYYVQVAPVIFPVIADRPLALKRFPGGITGPSFYQQKATTKVDGVHIETISAEQSGPRYVARDLFTFLYTVQLGTIAVHPWLSRADSLEHPDALVLDLDPGEGVKFTRVVEVADAVGEVLASLKLKGALKTSGSRGLHIFVPLPGETTWGDAAQLAEVIARRVAGHHPAIATIERSIKKRPKGTVYVDYLQNARGKTVACAYSVREKPGATVSTPLAWDELLPDLDPRDFTIVTVPDRVAEVGDLWKAAIAKPRSIAKALRMADADQDG
ncbi:MAG: dependent ligase [Gemmatimonadetes bacterium]|nr:dependent ligase [Gemmatimonadota bacterium]